MIFEKKGFMGVLLKASLKVGLCVGRAGILGSLFLAESGLAHWPNPDARLFPTELSELANVASMIKVGESIPDHTFYHVIFDEKNNRSANPQSLLDLISDQRVLIVIMPGVDTPVCDGQHLPPLIAMIPGFKALGVQRIIILTTDSPDVVTAWLRRSGVDPKLLTNKFIVPVSDIHRTWLSSVGLVRNGVRLSITGQRAALVVEKGILTAINVEDASQCKLSSADELIRLWASRAYTSASFSAETPDEVLKVVQEEVAQAERRREEADKRANDSRIKSESIDSAVKREELDDTKVKRERGDNPVEGAVNSQPLASESESKRARLR